MTVDYRVGDTRKVIAGIPDGSVDLIATSPPFLALRSYVPADHASKGDEIGSERNPAEFVDMLLGLTAEWGRVLAPHGSIAIELGDTYAGGGGWNVVGPKTPHRTGQSLVNGGKHPAGGDSGWPRAKSLALVPQLYAIALAYGINPLTGQPSPAGRWLVRNVIVWHRPNPAVGALGDKVRPSTSYIVIATRSAKRWFDLTAVRYQAPDQGVKQSNGVKVLEERAAGAKFETRLNSNPAGAPPLDAWFDEYDGSHDTWTLTTQPSRLAHYAMWPAKLAERLVLMMCPAQVCRVCGEPRRRIETATTYDTPRLQTGRPLEAVGSGHRSDRPAATPSTLGWTDCGCIDHRGLADTEQRSGRGGTPARPTGAVQHGSPDQSRFRPGHVLDPFAGSGTTLAVADLHGRDATGIDFDQRNHDLYPARYDEVKRSLFGTIPELPGQQDLFGVPA